MDAKLKSAMQQLKSAMAAVESCMSASSEDSEKESVGEEANVENEGHEEVMPEKADDSKKSLVMAMMKKKGY